MKGKLQQSTIVKNNESHSQTLNINYPSFSQKAAVQRLMLTIIHFPLKPFCTDWSTLHIHTSFQQLALPLLNYCLLSGENKLVKSSKQPTQCDAQPIVSNQGFGEKNPLLLLTRNTRGFCTVIQYPD